MRRARMPAIRSGVRWVSAPTTRFRARSPSSASTSRNAAIAVEDAIAIVFVEARIDMRRACDVGDSIGDCAARHRHCDRAIRRAIVDARQDMAVKIDHSATNNTPRWNRTLPAHALDMRRASSSNDLHQLAATQCPHLRRGNEGISRTCLFPEHPVRRMIRDIACQQFARLHEAMQGRKRSHFGCGHRDG